MANKLAFSTGMALMILLAGCGGEDSSGPPPVGGTPTPSPSPTPTPSPTPSPTSFVRTPDIRYGTGITQAGSIPLFVDIYRPQASCDAPRPTVVYVHGGGFVGGTRKGGNVEAIAQELAARGINLLSISYRLQGDNPVISSEFAQFERDFQLLNTTEPSARVTAFTAAVEDATKALRWAVDNAGAYCIDPQRFGVWGGSAGAFTVMHVAYSLDEYAIPRPPVRVAVDYWGGHFRVADLEAGEPPLFVMHGTADSTVPYLRATELTNRAQAVGVPFTLYSIIGGEHDFNGSGFFVLTVDGQSIAAKTATFVDAHMRAGGQPVYERRDIPR
ncbi:alpha/beta hydrolase [Porphyrobacter sp. LM 6]|uniref:alpha/beta hydrolase n=1 Tax=Porphyrobacter sp. LM 6 TaxID=1896196 RepID=UPI0008466DE5|nr:alpha/beta hydrolase [Porphyrobacter sp. LM 6]AOL93286.1 Acetyl esterase/lipase [Porphyrobacter sp. LM 6]